MIKLEFRKTSLLYHVHFKDDERLWFAGLTEVELLLGEAGFAGDQVDDARDDGTLVEPAQLQPPYVLLRQNSHAG